MERDNENRQQLQLQAQSKVDDSGDKIRLLGTLKPMVTDNRKFRRSAYWFNLACALGEFTKQLRDGAPKDKAARLAEYTARAAQKRPLFRD